MAKTLAQIQKQIDQLQRQAEDIRSKEAKGVIARIQEAIQHYNLTADDLFPKAKRGRKASTEPVAKKTRKVKSTIKPKYDDGNGNTWTGRGRQPRWLTAAVAEGKKPEDFLIDKS